MIVRYWIVRPLDGLTLGVIRRALGVKGLTACVGGLMIGAVGLFGLLLTNGRLMNVVNVLVAFGVVFLLALLVGRATRVTVYLDVVELRTVLKRQVIGLDGVSGWSNRGDFGEWLLETKGGVVRMGHGAGAARAVSEIERTWLVERPQWLRQGAGDNFRAQPFDAAHAVRVLKSRGVSPIERRRAAALLLTSTDAPKQVTQVAEECSDAARADLDELARLAVSELSFPRPVSV